MRSRIEVPMTTMRPNAAPSSRYTAIGSAKTVAASGNDTPCFARFDSAFAAFHSKSPSTIVAMATCLMGYAPGTVKPTRSLRPCPANAISTCRRIIRIGRARNKRYRDMRAPCLCRWPARGLRITSPPRFRTRGWIMVVNVPSQDVCGGTARLDCCGAQVTEAKPYDGGLHI